MRKLAGHSIIFGFLFLLLATAQDSAARRIIRVGYYDFNPLVFKGPMDVPSGLFIDILDRIAEEKNWKIEYVYGTWKETHDRLLDGRLDLVPCIGISEARRKVVDFSEEYLFLDWGVIYSAPDKKIETILDLDGKRVAVLAASIYTEGLKETLNQFEVKPIYIEERTYHDVFQLIEENKADAGISTNVTGLRFEQSFGARRSPIFFAPTKLAFAVRKGVGKELLAALDQEIARQKADSGSYYYQRYSHWITPLEEKTIPLYVWMSLGGLLAFLVLLGFWNSALKHTVGLKTRILEEEIALRKSQEGKLRENEERLRAVLEQSPIGIALSRNGIREDANHAFLRMFGYDQVEELKGRPLLEQIAPASREAMRLRIEKRSRGERVENMYETCGLRKDGTEFPVLVSATIISLPDGPATVSFYTDLTDQKLAEKERQSLQTQLAQAQKMEAIGTLAGGIAHDFNNILGAVLGYAEVARDECHAGCHVAQDLDQVILAGTRAKDLVKQILAFSRQTETEQIPLQPASIVKETIKLLRSSLPATIDIRQKIEPAGAPILADPTQIHQILINLCTNAFHAMEEPGGVLTISLANLRLSREDLAARPQLKPGLFVRLSVSDTGSGIAPGIRDRIFDPYFTTKETGKGTGMGLAIVHGIVKSYGGFIDCESTPGQGSTFHVVLPALQEEAVPEVQASAAVPVGSERILFVDDEPMLAEMSRTMLERLGYAVTVRTDSREALATFRKAPVSFDLLITDQTMPHLTGIELAREILRLRPQLPIILCTGYSNLISEEKVKAAGVRGFALKPLTRKSIAELIRQVLGQEKKDAYAH